jgi:hypothetical protein
VRAAIPKANEVADETTGVVVGIEGGRGEKKLPKSRNRILCIVMKFYSGIRAPIFSFFSKKCYTM